MFDTPGQALHQLRASLRGGLRGCSWRGALAGSTLPFTLNYLGPGAMAGEFDLLFEGAAHRGRPALRPDAMLVAAPFSACPPGWLRFNPFLQASVPVAATVAEQISAVGSKPHRRRLHAAERDPAWRFETSREVDACHRFLHELHRPYVTARFGTHALTLDEPTLLEHFLREGLVLSVHHGDQLVAGALLFLGPGGLKYERNGFQLDAIDVPHLLAERTAALELGVFRAAQQLGARTIELGYCRAFLDDGLFTHKRRLGAVFSRAAGTTAYALWVRPSLRARFFAAVPLVAGPPECLEAHLGFSPDATGDSAQEHARLRNVAMPSVRRVVAWAEGAPAQVHAFCRSLEKELSGRPVQLHLS